MRAPFYTLQDVEVSYRRSGTSGAPFCLRVTPHTYMIKGAPAGKAQCFTAEASDATLLVSVTGDVVEVAVSARESIEVLACHARVWHMFEPGEEVLMNGYQTWTDTVWRQPRARMRGLCGVPRALVRKFVLDGGGDYRFCHYDNKLGHQHGWTYACVRGAREQGSYVLLGSLDEHGGFTRIVLEAQAVRACDLGVRELLSRAAREQARGRFKGTFTFEPEVSPVPMRPGATRVLLRAAVIHEETEDAAFDRYFALMGCAARQAPALVGYCSWYRHFANIDAAVIERDLASCGAAFARMDAAGLDARLGRVFQIDDGWCKVGDWLVPDTAKFPGGLAPVAAAIREAGFVPGLWVSPFVCERDSRIFAEHPGWLLRDDAGKLQTTGCHWSGAFALDVLNPEVQGYVCDVLRTVVHEWGFGMLKLDFLYAACMLAHGGRTRGELMTEALRLVREAVGEGCLINACGVPLASACGRVEYCRVGCDVSLTWDDAPYMRLLHRERVSTKRALGNAYGRAPLDGRAFGNDTDVVMLRRDVRLTDAQRGALLEGAAKCSSVLLTSDDMSAWREEDLTAFVRAANEIAGRTK